MIVDQERCGSVIAGQRNDGRVSGLHFYFYFVFFFFLEYFLFL
jgi:hypothetical protein